jgi:hypothetical protein
MSCSTQALAVQMHSSTEQIRTEHCPHIRWWAGLRWNFTLWVTMSSAYGQNVAGMTGYHVHCPASRMRIR